MFVKVPVSNLVQSPVRYILTDRPSSVFIPSFRQDAGNYLQQKSMLATWSRREREGERVKKNDRRIGAKRKIRFREVRDTISEGRKSIILLQVYHALHDRRSDKDAIIINTTSNTHNN